MALFLVITVAIWGFIIWFAPYTMVVFGIYLIAVSRNTTKHRRWLSVGFGVALIIAGLLTV